jgi:hypothetical protein
MSDLADQTRNAFEFIEKLFLETSYLIKEVEGQLQQMPEGFVILRPSGYQVSALHSVGLEATNLKWWLRKVVAVGFVEETATKLQRGQTVTSFASDRKVLFLTIVFSADRLQAPTAFFGRLTQIENKNKQYTKFEHLMWEFPGSWETIFNTPPNISYDDGYCSFSGEFKKLKLYSLKTNEDVRKKLVEPMVKLYRG